MRANPGASRAGRQASRGLTRALENRTGGQLSAEERRRLGRLARRDVVRWAEEHSGAQATDEERKRRQTRTVGGRQGYNDREDESLGMRRGPERDSSQSFKDRRDESYGRWGTRDARRRRGER